MDDASVKRGATRTLRRFILFTAMIARCFDSVPAVGGDLAVTVLFDGERKELLNTWGGAWAKGNMREVSLQSQCVCNGRRALRLDLGRVEAGQYRYAQCLSSGFGRTSPHCQTRDLRRFERLEFRVHNATGIGLQAALQIKDYRDTASHQATYRFEVPALGQWVPIDIPLTIGRDGWTLEGEPDLGQVLTLDFAFAPQGPVEAGQIYLDDLTLLEPRGPADIDTSPLAELVERLARRQWDALWSARSRIHGLIPSHSYQATDAGLNTTAAVLWMLPGAVRRQWVDADEAHRYVHLLLDTLNRLRDRARHVPPRNVDWVTLQPSLLPEESAVDAAFLALALHQFKRLPSTPPALCAAIGETQDRFDFAAFACPAGWRMAYRYARAPQTEGFVANTYDGYTHEGSLISLAAHLSRRHHVPMETHWSCDVNRVRAPLAGLPLGPVVHSLKEFRAPFSQALWNLFVDVRQRGGDGYPDDRLAANPWQNFVCYQRGVMARLAELGRPYLVQPDAGDDGTLCNYQPYSLYEGFGQGDLFMPWSASFALLAGVDGADAALRHLLRHGLHDPLGLVDSARWQTEAAEPCEVTARHDFWNTGLATMALTEWLDGPCRASKSFAELPEVRQALDRVFRSSPGESQEASQVATTHRESPADGAAGRHRPDGLPDQAADFHRPSPMPHDESASPR